RASEIMAAVPTEDWTMTPDASGPTVLPTATTPGDASQEPTPAPAAPPKGPPTGDWTIQLDPDAGWSEPSKLAKPPDAADTRPAKPLKPRQPSSGNPVIAVASERPLEAVEWEEKPTGIGEAKIE